MLNHTTQAVTTNSESQPLATGMTTAARRAKSQASGTRATQAGRTTASHNIATKAGNLISKKNKGKGLKGKQKDKAPESDSGSDRTARGISLSDEDDSRERKAALSSPIKGKTSRELNKVSC